MRRICLPILIAASSTLGAQAPSITKKLTIGCESCGDVTQFGSINDVSVSADGRVLVTDRDAPMLRLFDTAGRSVWSSGRKGKGPGEYLMPYRSTLIDGGVVVVDMTNSRVTDLSASGSLTGSMPLLQFATTVGVTPRGEMILGMDNFGRSFRVGRRAPKGNSVETVAEFPGSMKNKSVALAPNGTMAVALDGEKYEIIRVDASGRTIDTLVRDIERPRRSTVEEAEYRQRLNRELSMMQTEMKKQGRDGKVKLPDIPPAERGLKGHITVDGLRFDASNRLWVLTQRGDESKSIFDVFAPGGSLLGSVTVPMRVTSYSLGGSFLVTSGENEEGIPVVTVWAVR